MSKKTLFSVESHEEKVIEEFFRRAATSMKLNGLSEARLLFPLEAKIPDMRLSFVNEDQNG